MDDLTKKLQSLLSDPESMRDLKELAAMLHERVGGDMAELKTQEPYPQDYEVATRQAKRELKAGARPVLHGSESAHDIVEIPERGVEPGGDLIEGLLHFVREGNAPVTVMENGKEKTGCCYD